MQKLRAYKMRMNSFEFIPSSQPISLLLFLSLLLLSSRFSSLSDDWESWQVLVKRDSIFTIIFFISFLTFLEFKLEKISRFPPKRLQVSELCCFRIFQFTLVIWTGFLHKKLIRIVLNGLVDP